ncbi:hypothetical protein MSG28_012255 [Choristoneura fumiferana]|uniref:Uncharacterized protein n=1 Tax=Choristoneura fumiferana TaxID=7141 RepID=A0ACC0KD13_CHOFU|nr:hypothetical protein MSG28_012255 [Choristoneura fumiferana]
MECKCERVGMWGCHIEKSLKTMALGMRARMYQALERGNAIITGRPSGLADAAIATAIPERCGANDKQKRASYVTKDTCSRLHTAAPRSFPCKPKQHGRAARARKLKSLVTPRLRTKLCQLIQPLLLDSAPPAPRSPTTGSLLSQPRAVQRQKVNIDRMPRAAAKARAESLLCGGSVAAPTTRALARDTSTGSSNKAFSIASSGGVSTKGNLLTSLTPSEFISRSNDARGTRDTSGVLNGSISLYCFSEYTRLIAVDIKADDFSKACTNGIFLVVWVVVTFQYGVVLTFKDQLKTLIRINQENFDAAESMPEEDQALIREYAYRARWVTKVWCFSCCLNCALFPIKSLVLTLYSLYIDDFRLVPWYDCSFPSVIEEINYVQLINDVFKVLYEISLKASAIMLPITLYQVIDSFKRHELCMEYMAFILTASLLCYVPCYYSDLLMEKGEALRLAIYSSGWEYQYDKSARYKLIIMLTVAIRPISIRSIFRTVCLDTFAGLCHEAYAIFNLINAMWN